MANALKTIQYVFEELDTLPDNTNTNLTQITVSIPETVVAFRSVTMDVMFQHGVVAAGNIARRQTSLQLGAAGYSAVNNTNTVTNSGEMTWLQHTADFTSYFTTNWSGTSMTCDARAHIDSSSGSPLLYSVTAVLTITYEYDDTASTHTKTVWIPLDGPASNLPSSKGAATDTIPALDTYLPEASKTYRSIAFVIQDNDQTTSTTDVTLSMEIDSDGARTTQIHEKSLNTAVWYRHVWLPSFDTSTTHSFYLWANTGHSPAPQVWMVVTYDFNVASTTRVMNSVLLPMEFDSPAGNSSSDWQRSSRQLWIQEPGTITIENCGLMLFWDQAAAVAGLNARVGSASFTAISNTGSMIGGGIGAMLRCEGDLTLARGKNTLQADVYRTDATNLVMNLCSVWFINYTSDKSSQGVSKHNHTVCLNVFTHGTGASDNNRISADVTPSIPEANYFINSIGVNYQYMTNSIGNAAGAAIQVERLSGEGGQKWDGVYADIGHTDPEQGIRQCWASARAVFRRWPGDDSGDRVDFEVARRWKAAMAMGASSWDHMDVWFTYHGITYTVGGDISDSDAGTVDIFLHREEEGDERVLTTSRSGDGAYSFTWYDNTQDVYVTSKDATGNAGRSGSGTATGTP